MKFTVTEEVEAAAERVFAEIGDPEVLARAAARRGVEVAREDGMETPGPGMTWRVRFDYRGRPREARIVLTGHEPPERLAAHSVSGGLEVDTVLDVEALSAGRSRIALEMVLAPKTLSARLLVQSLKLARGTLEKRLQARAAEVRREIEARLRKAG